MDPKNLLYGPRKSGPGPKKETTEGVDEFYCFLNGACEEQWLEVAEECVMEDIDADNYENLSSGDIYLMAEEFLYDEEWAENHCLVHYYRGKGSLRIFLTCRAGSCPPQEHVIELADAERVITPTGGATKWKMTGRLTTTEGYTVPFESLTLREIQQLDSRSPLLDLLIDRFKMDKQKPMKRLAD